MERRVLNYVLRYFILMNTFIYFHLNTNDCWNFTFYKCPFRMVFQNVSFPAFAKFAFLLVLLVSTLG